MTLGNQPLLAWDRMARLLEEADRERLISLARRRGRGRPGWLGRARVRAGAFVFRTVRLRGAVRQASAGAQDRPVQGVPSMPLAGHRG